MVGCVGQGDVRGMPTHVGTDEWLDVCSNKRKVSGSFFCLGQVRGMDEWMPG